MKKTQARRARLLEELQARQSITIPEIEKLFGVSQSTARRMCTSLHEEGKAIRTIGGVQALPEPGAVRPEYSFEEEAAHNMEEKTRIGRYASELVEDGNIIFASGGTTVQQFVIHLAGRLREERLSGITVMTNALDHVRALSGLPGVRVILTGGEYQPKRRDVTGPICERAINQVRFNQCFIGVDGVDLNDGLMALDSEIAAVDRAACSRADSVYVLTDHTKFKNRSYITYELLSPKHTVITDNGIDPDKLDQCASGPWKVVTV